MPDDLAPLSVEELERPRWSKQETHCVFCIRPLPTAEDIERHAEVECEPDPCWCWSLCWVQQGGDCTGPDGEGVFPDDLQLWSRMRAIEEAVAAALARAEAAEAERDELRAENHRIRLAMERSAERTRRAEALVDNVRAILTSNGGALAIRISREAERGLMPEAIVALADLLAPQEGTTT